MSGSAASSSNAALPPHLHLDAALLLSVDSSPVPRKLATSTPAERDALLSARAQAATQALISHLYTLPSSTHPDHGRIALLPAALAVGAGGTPLPREKPLPAPKAETKWEAFAKRKGINATTKKDKLVWDDDRKEWVPRWGFKGKNKDVEQQWIHELPNNAPDDHNPIAAARAERTARKLSNEARRARNVARATGAPTSTVAAAHAASASGLGGGAAGEAAAKRKADREQRKAQLDADVRRAKVSTASMGKFDKRLEGETKEKGVKRKFAPNEIDTSVERNAQLAMLNGLGGSASRSKPNAKGQGDEGLVNARKAVRFASGGRGSAALAGGARGGRGGRGGRGRGRGK